MEHFTQAVLALVRDTGVVGYWIALFAAFAETALVVGLLIPGSSFLLLMGVLAGQGVLDLGDLLAFAAVGAVLGDNINYFLGRKYGHLVDPEAMVSQARVSVPGRGLFRSPRGQECASRPLRSIG